MNDHPVPGLETLCLFDDARDEYIIINLGWRERRRVQYITLLVRIRNEKIWIEEDGTEEGFANLLTTAGVPKDDIVLAFNPPELRHLSEYAAA
jgi:hypothetical protein